MLVHPELWRIFACTDGCSSNEGCGCCSLVSLYHAAAWPLSVRQPVYHVDWRSSFAAWPLSVLQFLQPFLSLWVMHILCSLASPCSSVSDVRLSLLCCWAAALSSVVLAARLALSHSSLSHSSLCLKPYELSLSSTEKPIGSDLCRFRRYSRAWIHILFALKRYNSSIIAPVKWEYICTGVKIKYSIYTA